MKTNIALIGFMGTGKTVVGQVLAKKLDRKFIELDSLIEQQAGKPILEIFQQDGEIAFRELEIEVTKKIAQEKYAIIACGGGVVLNKINIDRLKREGIIVYLTASPRAILKRVASEKGQRPLLEVDDQLKTIGEMLKFRKPFYERAADIKINTSRLNIEAVAEKIIEELKEKASTIATFAIITKNDTPQTPVISAIWITGRLRYCEYPKSTQGNPVKRRLRMYSSKTQTEGINIKTNGVECLVNGRIARPNTAKYKAK